MKKILFPTDCSDMSKNALDYAVELAKILNTQIDVLSIYNLVITDASVYPSTYMDEIMEETKKSHYEKVNKFVVGYEEWIDDIEVDNGVFIATEICEEAKDGDYAMIVMGTKGSHNAFEKLMGSVTSNVMMYAPCPVLAIPESATFRPIKKVAYATDFHLKEPQIMLELLDLCNALGAVANYVHVDKKEDNWENEIESIAGFAKVEHVSNPSVHEGLDQYIKDNEIDILAMFIPKRRLWEKLFHRSNTKRMALHTHTPLLSFREKNLKPSLFNKDRSGVAVGV